MVVPHKALKPRWKSANVSTGWRAQVAVRARPKRHGVMMRCRRQNFASVPQALSRGSEDPGIRLRRDSWVSVMYAEELNSTTSSVTLQRTDRHGILGQKSSHCQMSL